MRQKILLSLIIFSSLFALIIGAQIRFLIHTQTERFYEPQLVDEKVICSNKICTLAIVTKNNIYGKIKKELSDYGDKIKSEFNYRLKILKYNDDVTNNQIKKDLSNLYQNEGLRGVILVGDISTFKVGMHCEDPPRPERPCLDFKPASNGIQPSGGWFSFTTLDISDIIYADVDNLCEYNSDKDAYYWDSPKCIWGKPIKLPFWVSRIYPHSSTGNDVEQIKGYFQNNLAYRNGEISFQKKHLAYAPMLSGAANKEEEIFIYYNHLITGAPFRALPSGEQSETDLSKIDDSDTETYKKSEITFLDDSSTDEKFFEELDKGYETVVLNAHGTPQGHEKQVTPEFIKNYNPKAVIFEFKSCSVGRFIVEDYLVGRYMADGTVLYTIAPTRVYTDISPSPYDVNFLLKQGSPIFQVIETAYWNGRAIFGDPTIRISNPRIRAEAPKVKINKMKLDFDQILIDQSREIKFKIKNEGKEPLKIGNSITVKYTYGSDIKTVTISLSDIIAKNKKEGIVILNENESALIILRVEAENKGRFSGNIYLKTNDPEHYFIKIPFEGEVVGEAKCPLLGDVTHNNKIDCTDAHWILDMSVGKRPIDLKCGDVSGNGEVTAYDAALLMKDPNYLGATGDVNHDDSLSYQDKEWILEMAVGKRSPDIRCGDISGDGKVTSYDAALLMQNPDRPEPLILEKLLNLFLTYLRCGRMDKGLIIIYHTYGENKTFIKTKLQVSDCA